MKYERVGYLTKAYFESVRRDLAEDIFEENTLFYILTMPRIQMYKNKENKTNNGRDFNPPVKMKITIEVENEA